MKLSDLSISPARRMRDVNNYLKENFGYTLDASKLDQPKIARAMEHLRNQQWDISCEVKDYQNNAQYAKSVMMSESLRLIAQSAPKADKQATKKQVSESANRLRVLLEQNLEQAEVALAAKSMAEDVKGMAEKIAKMQVETLMALVDTMKTTHGTDLAKQFNDSVEASLQVLLDTLKKTHDDLSNAASVVAGEEGASFTGMESPSANQEDFSDIEAPEAEQDEEPEQEPGIAGAPAASGPIDQPTGREMK